METAVSVAGRATKTYITKTSAPTRGIASKTSKKKAERLKVVVSELLTLSVLRQHVHFAASEALNLEIEENLHSFVTSSSQRSYSCLKLTKR